MTTSLKAAAERARSWLFDTALPLWSEVGFDEEGFVEKIAHDGSKTADPRRAMVQARQIYSYVEAGRLGWQGPWRSLVEQGVEGLSRWRIDEGRYAFWRDPATGQMERRLDLYTHAFLIFTLGHAWSVLDRPEALKTEAKTILAQLRANLAHELGGFDEAKPRTLPIRSNPHMHLLEAALVWMDYDTDPVWRELADEVVGLCRGHFIDPSVGALREYFDAEWKPMDSDEGLIIEPGHQFEWAWLLDRWGVHAGQDVSSLVDGLYGFAAKNGIDAGRSVAINEVWLDGSVKDDTARLWPQTERIKAALTLSGRPGRQEIEQAAAVDGVEGLFAYLQTPVAGLWRDKYRKDGSFVEEAAPASSFYHIICAFGELLRAA